MPSRRLEVVVLAARGLNTLDDGGERSRRSVELALICPTDATGEEFGTKTSPWVLPAKTSKLIWFGRSGLRAGFPLEGPHAPEIAGEKRFLQHAELRIRLYHSGMNTASPTLMFAKSILPTDLANAAAKGLDNATAQLEAETRISLEDMLASEPDAYRNGWIDLHRTNILVDPEMPQIWMQVFVLPDHEKHVPKLNEDYEAEGSRMPNFRPAPCTWVSVQPTPSRTPVDACADKSIKSAGSLTGRGQVAPKAAPKAPPNASGQHVVVPPGINPGDFFTVHGVVVEHKVTCPPDKSSGDKWQIVSPLTQQLIIVEIPSDIRAGQNFLVKETQMRQAQCPEGASPGDTVQLAPAPPPMPPTPNPNVMQVVCPVGKGPGDIVPVYIQETEQTATVEVPPGVFPGMVFQFHILGGDPPNGVQPNGLQPTAAKAFDPAADLLIEMTETWGTPCDNNGVPITTATSPSMPKAAQEDLIMASTPPASPTVKDPNEESDLVASLLETKAETPAKILDLPVLYAEQAKIPRPNVDISLPGKLEDSKFAPLDRVGRGVDDSELEVSAEKKSLQALQDDALANLSQTIRKATNDEGEVISYI